MLAIVLVYLILAAQFESFVDPLTILFTVPLAVAGAFISLWIFGQTLNIFSQIGMIMLIGLVTKNSKVRLVDSENNWYQVDVVEQGRVRPSQVNATRGWLNGRYLDLDEN